MRTLRSFFLATDIGFIIYWLITVFNIIPESMAFKDYYNPILVSWNWSFLPLDLFVSFTGLYSIYLEKIGKDWTGYALVSLALTFCSGLQAIAFWILRLDFDISWWVVNLYLLVYPLFFLKGIMKLRSKSN